MICPKCDCLDIGVTDSRSEADNTSIRRRRNCSGCGHKFTTCEVVMPEALLVACVDGSERLPMNSVDQFIELTSLLHSLSPDDAVRRQMKALDPRYTRQAARLMARAWLLAVRDQEGEQAAAEAAYGFGDELVGGRR